MSQLARSSLLFTIGTFLSRISGLIRDSVLTGVFGASSAMEAFWLANRIPNVFRDMLAEGALGSSFTKVYTGLSMNDEARAKTLLSDAFRFGFLMLIGISVVGGICAPWLVHLFTAMSAQSGRPENFVQETITLTRVLFPFLGFAVLAALAGGVLQKRGQFFLASVSSSALNIGYIVGALLLADSMLHILPDSFAQYYSDRRIFGLALGVVLGGLLHFASQFYFIWRDTFKNQGWSCSKTLISKDLLHVFVLMAPAAVSSSAGTINLLVNTNFATSLETGAITWLNYSFRLLQLPIGVFAVAVGSVVLPSLTRAVTAAGQRMDANASAQLQQACEAIAWIMMACFAYLLMNSYSLSTLLFKHGAYTENDTLQTSYALAAYSYGILGYGLIKVLSSFYFAVERTTFALKVSLSTIALNAIANYLLVSPFGHVGLAMTSSITLSINAILLIVGTRSSKVQWQGSYLLKTSFIILLATGFALGLQTGCTTLIQDYVMDLSTQSKIIAAVLLFINATIVAFVFLLGLSWHKKMSPKELLLSLRSIRKR